MNDTEIRAKVIEILTLQLQVEASSIHDETDIAKDLGADSLDLVEIVMELEDAFGIIIDDENEPKTQTLASLVEIVKKLM